MNIEELRDSFKEGSIGDVTTESMDLDEPDETRGKVHFTLHPSTAEHLNFVDLTIENHAGDVIQLNRVETQKLISMCKLIREEELGLEDARYTP